jgi:HEAT repeat protein
MAAVIVLGGWYAFEEVLTWSHSDNPIEAIKDGAEGIREMEAAMGEERLKPASSLARNDEPPPGIEGADRAADQPAEDTGPVMDLERLTKKDLDFLAKVLREGDPEARLSATRALVASDHPAGIHLLFEAAGRGGEDAILYCLGALDIARMQLREDAFYELLLAMEQQPPLPADCRAEVADRFALLGARDPAAALELAGSEHERVRQWAVRTLADEEGEVVEEVMVAMVRDPSAAVRADAWVAWGGREIGASRSALEAAARAEEDPDVAASAREVLGL